MERTLDTKRTMEEIGRWAFGYPEEEAKMIDRMGGVIRAYQTGVHSEEIDGLGSDCAGKSKSL